jgi:hypothetical protein
MSKLIAIVFFASLIFSPFAAQARVAEVDISKVDAIFANQETPAWCWAASIEMALRYYGVKVDQKTIVARTFGAVVPISGDFIVISSNLNYSFDLNGKKYIVSASILPINNSPYVSNPWAATPEAIVNQLKKGRIIVVAYQSSTYSGHAVLLSGVEYEINPQGHVVLTSLTVRDPYPYSNEHLSRHGMITYANGRFPGPIQAIWLVDITAE